MPTTSRGPRQERFVGGQTDARDVIPHKDVVLLEELEQPSKLVARHPCSSASSSPSSARSSSDLENAKPFDKAFIDAMVPHHQRHEAAAQQLTPASDAAPINASVSRSRR